MALTNAERQAAHRARLKARLAEKPAISAPAPALPNIPATRRWNAMRDQAENLILQLRNEIQAYYDDRTEQWQDSDRGQEMNDRLSTLESILTELDSLKS